MRKRTKYIFISLRETSLVSVMLLSLVLCYLLSECILILIQYFFEFDVVISQDIHKHAFMYPNLILLTILFFCVRDKAKIRKLHLILIPLAFYIVQYVLLLLFVGKRDAIGGYMYGSYSGIPMPHIGLRDFYCSMINRFHEEINLWDTRYIWLSLLIAFLLYIGSTFLYVFLRNYVRRKTHSPHFADPVNSSETPDSSRADKPKKNSALVVLRKGLLIAYLLSSLALCYMIAESLVPLLINIRGIDYALTQYEYELYYILPNVVFLIWLFFWLHKKDNIRIELLMPVQLGFYIAYHLFLLFVFGSKIYVYILFNNWRHRYPNSRDLHRGLRDNYLYSAYNTLTFKESRAVWVMLGFVFLVFFVLGILYRLLQDHINKKSMTPAKVNVCEQTK